MTPRPDESAPRQGSALPILDYRTPRAPGFRSPVLGATLRALAGLAVAVVTMALAIGFSDISRSGYPIFVFPLILVGVTAEICIVYRSPLWLIGVLFGMLSVGLAAVLNFR